jgi:hypothetical protein
VGGGGVLGDMQLGSYLAVGETLRYQGCYFLLAVSELDRRFVGL